MRDSKAGKWDHLNKYERRYLQSAMQAYNEIMENITALPYLW
jgi:hypothetical protein